MIIEKPETRVWHIALCYLSVAIVVMAAWLAVARQAQGDKIIGAPKTKCYTPRGPEL